jgi:hypothetical protein
MKVALIPLGLGSLLTWLLAGPFRALLESTLPPHFGGPAAEAGSAETLWSVLASPATWIALGVVALGFALFLLRRPLAGLTRALEPLRRAADSGYGFESVNRGVSRGALGAGEGLRATQTGLLNWNIAAIVMAVVVVLAVLVFAAGTGV